MKVGDTVGGTYRGEWRGVVLDVFDPASWVDTMLAELLGTPTPEAIRAHLEENPRFSRVPVRWDFGAHGPHVYFERRESLYVVP